MVHAATDVLAPPRFDPRDPELRLSGEVRVSPSSSPIPTPNPNQVHDQLHALYEPLCALFVHACRAPGGGEGGEGGATPDEAEPMPNPIPSPSPNEP